MRNAKTKIVIEMLPLKSSLFLLLQSFQVATDSTSLYLIILSLKVKYSFLTNYPFKKLQILLLSLY